MILMVRLGKRIIIITGDTMTLKPFANNGRLGDNDDDVF